MNCETTGNAYNSYKELKKYNSVACDICDKVFNNRFDSIIHNASHIIIPLLKQNNILICDKCQAIFTSQDDLQFHIFEQHPAKVVIEKEINIRNNDFNLNKVKKEPIDDIDTLPIEPIKNRLKFEDEDIICNEILKDIVTECKVNVQICNEWNNIVKPFTNTSLELDLEEDFTDLEKKSLVDRLILDEPLTDEYECDNFALEPTEREISDSFHYDDLIRRGSYYCKYCTKCFPSRFSLIQHEVVHISLRKSTPLLCPNCDKFIAGNCHNLNKHIEKEHYNNNKHKNYIPKTCKTCGLKYRKYSRHAENYHSNIYNEAAVNNICFSTKTKSVCSLCIKTLMSKCNQRYILRGTSKSVEGIEMPCHVCGKKCFKLNIIEKQRKNCSKRHQKKMTNEDRLKIIQRRFQRLNLLSKF